MGTRSSSVKGRKRAAELAITPRGEYGAVKVGIQVRHGTSTGSGMPR